MLKTLALALPLALAPLPAAAQDFSLTTDEADNLRCAVVFALTAGFNQAGLEGFEQYGDIDARGEEYFVETMVSISEAHDIEGPALMPLVEEQVGELMEDPDTVAAMIPECLYLLEDFEARGI